MNKMEKPNLNRMWNTWVQICPWPNLTYKRIQDTIRHRIYPTFTGLKNDGTINWYHFLIHPYPEDTANAYFHIRFSVTEDIANPNDLNLPDYCVSTDKLNPQNLRKIAGIDESLLINEDIAEAWRIIGEQSEWFLEMLSIHKEDVDIAPQQIKQFLHFYANMAQLQVR